MNTPPDLAADIRRAVEQALAEDIGSGDLTAALIPETATAEARVLCLEQAVLCGCDWFNQTFAHLSDAININWQKQDGDRINANEVVCRLNGPARALLSGERTALNFLQLLSATATATRHTLEKMRPGKAKLLDTRKTIPGLRTAQKYAVRCGGGDNHRIGLYDAILIKDNHIKAAGGIDKAVSQAKADGVKVEVEVESLQELAEALQAGADIILLDNFSLQDIKTAVTQGAGRAALEVSGNADAQSLPELAATGVDYISIGALTKNIRAIDFSMLID
ncbi:MAG: carboxylating nicotinate-nucleotide diphosphorylase [Gammaproteobacteria bacterium]